MVTICTKTKQKNIKFFIYRRIPNVETYTLSGLYPDTLYYIWLAARSQRGEGGIVLQSIKVNRKFYYYFLSSFLFLCSI